MNPTILSPTRIISTSSPQYIEKRENFLIFPLAFHRGFVQFNAVGRRRRIGSGRQSAKRNKRFEVKFVGPFCIVLARLHLYGTHSPGQMTFLLPAPMTTILLTRPSLSPLPNALHIIQNQHHEQNKMNAVETLQKYARSSTVLITRNILAEHSEFMTRTEAHFKIADSSESENCSQIAQ